MAVDAYAVAIARTAEYLTSNSQKAVTAEQLAQAMFPFGPDLALTEEIRRRLPKAAEVMTVNDGVRAYALKAIYFDEFATEPPTTSDEAKSCLAVQAKDAVGLARAMGDDDVIWEAAQDKMLGKIKTIFRAKRMLEGYAARGLIDEDDVDAYASKARLEIETTNRFDRIIFPQLGAGSGPDDE